MAIRLIAPRRGRPPKFGRPARTVTLTLPEDVIAALSEVDPDLSRAAVRLLAPAAHDVVPFPPAELSQFRDSAVIIVKPVPALETIEGVGLVPLPDGRALLSLDPAMTVHEFELKLRDLLDDEGAALLPRERSVLVSVSEILRSARKAKKITIRQRSIIVLQSTSHRRVSVS